MKKKTLSSVLALCFLFTIVSVNLFSEGDSNLNYGHISYVDKGATVIRQDDTQHKAVVNLPVVPGDQIVTGKDGRCELQFDNGTILRLDRNSRLKVTTILAPTMTSKWKVTTLHLMEGQLYSMTQGYNRQMFQVITPNAAINLKKRVGATIRLTDDGETYVYTEKGKAKVLLGESQKELDSKALKKKQGYLITKDHQLTLVEDQRDIDFIGFNTYVNRNFKDTHYGVSKVPKKIYRYSKGLVHWAEKWSTLFGEWVYDDLFGYVWKPADEVFAISKRPFFHAQYVKVNGQSFVVPTQPWGWAPSHMGTWVWMKWGWTWVPGDVFGSSLTSFNRLDYWVRSVFGSYSLYYTYRDYGYERWYYDCWRLYNRTPTKPNLKVVPKPIRKIIKKMNRISVTSLRQKLGTNRPAPVVFRKGGAPFMNNNKLTIKSVEKKIAPKTLKGNTGRNFKSKTVKTPKGNLATPGIKATLSKRAVVNKNKRAVRGNLIKKGFRDFNPDVRWGHRNGFRVNYSSRINATVIPKLNMDSRSRPRGLMRSKGGVFFNGRRISSSGSSSGSSSSSSGSSSGSGSGSSTQGSAGSSGSGKSGGPGSSGSTTKQ
ncbi:MAG: FecR domain-containing protein [bacterium]|nr:FecR domain-containing protein [bacterium]